MRRIEINIKQIQNGWLLTLETMAGEVRDTVSDVKDLYFKTFPEVLAHLHELNLK